MRFGQAVCCTQHVAMWDPKVDVLEFGDDPHYAAPLKKWGFEPLVKVSSNDFKIAAFKPAGWMDGAAAQKAVAEHERQIAAGTKPGLVVSPNACSAQEEDGEDRPATRPATAGARVAAKRSELRAGARSARKERERQQMKRMGGAEGLPLSEATTAAGAADTWV